jgi:hypothetical protein
MQTIDITPRWADLMAPLLSLAYEGKTTDARIHARGELFRMAQAADRWNAAAPDLVRCLEFILADLNTDLSAETAGLIQSAIDKARGKE